MALRRVFVESITGASARAHGRRAHHLHRVVRLRPGELVEISNYEKLFLAEVKRSSSRAVEFEIREQLAIPEPDFTVVLQLGIFKFSRLEWAIEKATELGVASIVPVAAERSERGLVQAAVKRRQRWQRIAEEAAQQSRRLAPPKIAEPVSFVAAVGGRQGPSRLFLDSGPPPLREVVGRLAADFKLEPPATLLVGPEGGWTDAEREAARQAGYHPASLGPLILRAETAAVAALAVVGYLLHERTPSPISVQQAGKSAPGL